jgi:hypothetical protein
MTEPVNSAISNQTPGSTSDEPTFDPQRWNQHAQDIIASEQARPKSAMDYVTDVPSGVMSGVTDASRSALQLGNKLTQATGGFDLADKGDLQETTDPRLAPQTWLGGITRGLTAFTLVNAPLGAAGEVAAGAVGLTEAASAGSKLAKLGDFAFRHIGIPAVSEKVLYDAHAARFSNLIEQYPQLSNPLTRWLKAKPGDGAIKANVKQTMEGALTNAVGHFAFKFVGSFFKMKSALDAGDSKAFAISEQEARDALNGAASVQKMKSDIRTIAPHLSDSDVNDAFTPVVALAKAAKKTVDDWFSGQPLRFVAAEGESGSLNQQTVIPQTDVAYRMGEANRPPQAPPTPEVPQAKKGPYAVGPEPVQAGQTLPDSRVPLADQPPVRGEIPVEPVATQKIVSPDSVPLAKDLSPDALPVEDVRPQEVPLAEPAQPVERLPLAGNETKPDPYDLKLVRKGWIRFTNDGQSIIGLFKSADVSTLNHELFHYVRRWGLSPALQDSLAAGLGTTVDQLGKSNFEEKAARMYERYLADGKSPTPELQPVFDRVRKAMGDIYTDVNNSDIRHVVSDPVRSVFDRILTGEPVKLSDAPKLAAAAATPASRLDQVFSADSVKAFTKDVQTALASGQSFSEAAYNARTHFNWGRINTLDDARLVQSKLISFLEEERGKLGSEPMKLVDVAKTAADIADDLMVDPDALTKIASDREASEGLATRLVSYRMFRNSLATTAGELNKLSIARPHDVEIGGRAALANKLLMQVMDDAKVIETNMARGPSFGRIVAGTPEGNPLDAALQKLAGDFNGDSGPVAQRALRLALAMAGDDAGAIRSVAKWAYGKTNKLLSIINELHINALISSPRTVSKIVMTEFMQAVMAPVERSLGGALENLGRMSIGGEFDPAAVKSGARLFTNHIASILDMAHIAADVQDLPVNPLSAAKQAFLSESTVLRPHMESDFHGAISSGNLGIDPNGNLGTAVDWIGKKVRLPQRLHMATDEFFQQLQYQSALRANAFEEAERQGLKAGTKPWGEAVSKYVQDGYDSSGAGRDPEAMKLALATTMNTDLGSVAGPIQRLVNSHPVFRLLVPFVKKPANLFRTFVQYLPLGLGGMIESEFGAALTSSNPNVRASAIGRAAVGTAIWSLAIAKAASGGITGGGPQNRKARERLLETGWQPYSMVTNNPDGSKSYASYKSIEPWNRVFSMSGDYVEIANHLTDNDQHTVATAMVGALAHGLTNETYITSIRQAAEAISTENGVDAQSRFVDSFLGGFVPMAESRTNPDDYLRQAHNLIDSFKKRIWGLSDKLPPVRTLFGEPVPIQPGRTQWGTGQKIAMMASPIDFSKTVDDKVKQEVADLRFGFSPPPRTYQGIDLSLFKNEHGQDAADWMAENIGKVSVGGRRLHDALDTLVKSGFYQSLSPPEKDNDITNGRVLAVNKMISAYRNLTESAMLKAYPDVQKAVLLKRQQVLNNRTPTPSPRMALLSQ